MRSFVSTKFFPLILFIVGIYLFLNVLVLDTYNCGTLLGKITKTSTPPLKPELKALVNLPPWYRNSDWGLVTNDSLQNIRVTPRALDNEEQTAWANFFFGTEKGLMLEMGAMNGKDYSVSAFFENNANWRTILIEGNPKLSSHLSENRPNSISFDCAICDVTKQVHFIHYDNPFAGVDGILEFMSIGFLRASYPELLTNGNNSIDWAKVEKDKRVVKLQCFPLETILTSLDVRHINFFLLDVEGGELEVLRTLDFRKITFDVLAVETDRGTEDNETTNAYVDSVAELLGLYGYDVWSRKIGRNTWFISKNYQPHKKPLNTNI